MDWSKKKYDDYYKSYVPWLEDKYLAWFGENKASYTAKDQLSKTKITGDKNIDAIQDGLNEGVGGQFAKGGLLGFAGEGLSREGVNRAERGDAMGLEKGPDEGKGVGGKVAGGLSGVGGSVQSGVGGLLGGSGGGKEGKK